MITQTELRHNSNQLDGLSLPGPHRNRFMKDQNCVRTEHIEAEQPKP